ncbi:MAG TPA: NAD(P)-dependent oxidoreductase [Casimicrobiaceae bacterium]|nr:NAD(P)-dependent oxidoreductase [Casimicrobiaceae bacterium]
MARIFLTFPPHARKNYYSDRALAALRAVGEVALNETDHALTMPELVASASGVQFIVSDRQTPGDGELFRRLPDLVAFSRCAVDIRNVDVATASECGILVTQASAGFMTSVAEWVIGVMIDLSRRVSASVVAYRAGEIAIPVMGRELKGSALGVVGYGNIGRRLCELASALGMRVAVTDPAKTVDDDPRITQVGFDELVATSDFVVCLAPANAHTENLFDARAFARMRPTAYFINASRGDLVDESALERALDAELIAGCALDVGRAPDQMPTARLARHPKVVATPHVGGLTPEAAEHQALETVAQVAALIEGKIPKGAVNAEHAARLARLRNR